VFPARTAAEIITCQQDLCPPELRFIEDKLGSRRFVVVIAPVIEERLGQAVLICDLEKLRRDDLVRINIVNGQRHYLGCKCCKLSHKFLCAYKLSCLPVYGFSSVSFQQKLQAHKF